MASEFDLIARYFTRTAPTGLLGVGDDCALFPVPPGEQVATSTDLLLEGRHFFPDVDPKSLGHKALAVNLSDLAAMGARPIGCVLGLALPRLDEPWLAAFADGFHALAAVHGCPLIGGDTTRSAHDLAISVTVFGAVPANAALRRDGARAGDDIWVSGELGAADVAYRLLDGQYPADPERLAATRGALEWPEPQVPLGLALRGIAHAAIDISDGLLQDLGHILAASRVGAVLHEDRMPAAAALAGLPAQALRRAVLGGGDVYQLCFTAPAGRRDAVLAAARSAGARVTRVGGIVAREPAQDAMPAATRAGDTSAPAGAPRLVVLDATGQPLTQLPAGFDHFPGA